MKKGYPHFLIIIFTVAAITFACKQKSNPDKYKDLPKELAELCLKIDQSPKNADLYEKRSDYYIKKRQLDSAFSDAFSALKLDSSNSKRYRAVSDIYFMKGDFEASEDMLERAYAKNPSDVEAIMKLAELNLYYKRYKELNDYIDKALTIDQRNPKAHLLKGFGLIEEKDTVGAVREYQLAVDQDPNYYEAYIQLGLIFHHKHNKLAIDYYNNALNVRPNSMEAMYNIAMFYQDTKEYNRAISQYQIILKSNPRNKLANHNIGWIEMEIKKNYSEAIKYFTLSVQSDSTYVDAIYNRGLANERLKNYKEADKDFKKALQFDGTYQLAIDGVARMKKH